MLERAPDPPQSSTAGGASALDPVVSEEGSRNDGVDTFDREPGAAEPDFEHHPEYLKGMKDPKHPSKVAAQTAGGPPPPMDLHVSRRAYLPHNNAFNFSFSGFPGGLSPRCTHHVAQNITRLPPRTHGPERQLSPNIHRPHDYLLSGYVEEAFLRVSDARSPSVRFLLCPQEEPYQEYTDGRNPPKVWRSFWALPRFRLCSSSNHRLLVLRYRCDATVKSLRRRTRLGPYQIRESVELVSAKYHS